MQAQFNIVPAKVNTLGSVTKKITQKVCYVPNEQWKQNKKRLFEWGDSLAKDKKLTPTFRIILKGLMNCCDIHGISHASIPAIAEATAKIAPYRRYHNNTIKNAIKHFVKEEIVQRIESPIWRKTTETRLLAPFLVEQQGTKIVPVLPRATDHNINNNTKVDIPRENKVIKLDFVLNKEQLAILATILSWGTWKGLAKRWVQTYSVHELQGGIDYMNKKNIDHDNRGGYMRKILESLDQRKEEIKKTPTVNNSIPGLMATDILLSQMDDYKRSDLQKAKSEIQKLKGLIKK